MKASDMPDEHLAAKVRANLAGRGFDWGIEAAADLAVTNDRVLEKVRGFITEDGWIPWAAIAAHVGESGWSSGEKALIRFACSLAGEVPEGAGREWSLGRMLDPLDGGNARDALEAVRYAAMGPRR